MRVKLINAVILILFVWNASHVSENRSGFEAQQQEERVVDMFLSLEKVAYL